MEETNKELLIAEIDIVYNSQVKASQRPILQTPGNMYEAFLRTWDETKIELVEQFKVLLLNKANRALGICTLSTGNVDGTIADPKQVFAVALLANAVKVVIAHNHPSGSLHPSVTDQALTRKMKLAGDFLEIKVLDHLIVTKEGYFSFAEAGVL